MGLHDAPPPPPPPQAQAQAAAEGQRDPPHWLFTSLQGIVGGGVLSTLLLCRRQMLLGARLGALEQAPHVPVEQLQPWWERQQGE